MIDFFEYVVAELKSKRLSKTNAVELVRQFSGRSSNSPAASIIHPLLHLNTSDLSEQRYTSTFTGEEFFLADHQVKLREGSGQKVLPGAAYLEMARAATEQALSGRGSPAVLDLQGVVWAQPAIVSGKKELNIALWEIENQQIEYEVYSWNADQKMVHCHGRVGWSFKAVLARLDIELLRKRMQQGTLQSGSIYAAFTEMNMAYGPGFQAVTAIYQGNGEVLAHLKLPKILECKYEDYVLHPSLIDSAFQACLGLAKGSTKVSNETRLPYAVESVRIIAPCTKDMFAWARYADGSEAENNLAKVDIDLCDEQGNICVQIQGFSYRILKSEKRTPADHRQGSQAELQSFIPVWKPAHAEIHKHLSDSTRVLLLGGDQADLDWVKRSHANASLVSFSTGATTDIIEAKLKDHSFDHLLWIAPDVLQADGQDGEGDDRVIEEQEAGVLAIFRTLKALLRLGYGDKNLRWTVITRKTQSVTEDDQVQPTHAGIFGFVGSLAKEYPHWKLSLLDVDSLESLTAGECLSIASDDRGNGLVYRTGRWFAQHFIQIPLILATPVHYKQKGVYVVIGGAGGLGQEWTRFMLECYQAHVIWIGRRQYDVSIKNKINALSALGSAPLYISADATKLDELQQAHKTILQKYSAIDGVVHSAGVLNDQTLALMDEAQFRAGFSAKVDTTVNMNRVFGGENLGLMLFFSSIVSFVKSPAQSNYAAGCTFKDSFAHRLKKTRPYAVKVMNWGYWGSVGGAADEYHNKTMERMSIGSIEADEGMTRLQSLVSSGLNQMAVIKMLGSQEIPYLTLSRLNSESAEVSDHKLLSPIPSPPEPSGVQPTDTDSLREKGIVYFQKLIASTLKMRPDQIEPRRSLADYGLDSILVGQLTFKLRKAFPGVNATLLFEVKNIEGLVDYFIKNKKQELAVLVLPAPVSPATQTEQASPVPAQPQGQYTAGTRGRRNAQKSTRNIAPYGGAPDRGQIQPDFQTRSVTPANRSIFDVAVIGLSGRYPGAKNLKELWTKLSNGVNCITEIPKERWKWEDYYDPEKGKSGKIYTRWGGFLEGIDQFDPLFFKISPKEARTIDPQERLFLESCYHAIEDAGYTPESLGTPEKVGVFVGVMNSRYGRQPAHFSVANRVSFIFNFQGPSMAVDTACSASLTAIHLALEGIYNGDCKCAIAGGVNLIIDPVHYFQLTEMRMLSSGGECRVFGDQADGVVDGEGVGAVILKPLQEAERDGDHIYGVIKASAINAGGKTNGYTVPNPQAQARVVVRALERARIPAEHLSYIEAHGTGTPLGDPIEIAGLTRAFNESSGDIQSSCPIGSLKSNIGHCESAAGIAGLTKVLLQLKHQQLAPSLHSEIPNPEIDFSQTPFKLQRTLEHWARPVRERSGVMQEIPRIAGISSFGAGGANAHLIVQEHMSSTELSKSPRRVEDTGVVILLSARSAEQLKQKASDLLDLIREEQPSPTSRDKKLDLVSMAYTLQVGREPMEERLGLIVNSAGQLVEKLEAYVEGERDIEGAYQGQVKRGHEALSFFSTDADLQRTVDKWIANRKVSKLLELWVKGLEVDWSKLYGESRPQRMSLPTYPFAKERYWMDTAGPRQIEVNKDVAPVIHPLLHRNTSDLSEQRFSSTFAGDEFFLADHQVKLEGNAGQKILPGVAYLELARAALEQAWPECRESAVLELRNVVFAHPVVVTGSRQINIALLTRQNDQVDFEVYSHDADQEIIHCQGLALCSQEAKPATIDIEYLKKAMQRDKLESGSVYAAWSRIGVIYGPAFQAITALYRGTDQALAQLRLPDAVAGQAGDYVLHPSLMDGALQAAIGLIDTQCEAPTSPRIPFALDSLRIIALCSREMFAWVRYAAGIRAEDSFAKLDIDLCDERGNVCVQMHGLSSRVLGKENIDSAPTKSVGRLLAIPVWQNSAAEIAANADRIAYTEHNIILCGLSEVAVEQLISLLPDSQCVSLPAAERKNFAERYSDYALACFKRIQAVLQGKPQGKVLLQIIVGGDREQAVLSGLWGLLRTATLENPQVIGQLLIVPTGVTTDELGRYLQTEMCRPSDEMVRYEQGVRQVVRWQEIPEDAGTPPVPFKDHGTYLITGGLGALGILFAKEILRQVPQAKVVLTGRSALNVEKQSLVDGLCTPAGRVSYRQVDVSNSDEVGNLVAAIKSENGQINGIMHSAGIISDNFILKKSTTEFKNVLAPKVKGTYNLDEATREIELDFFVLFSSISGAMGNVGQSDYAVANGFMDQFAAYRNALVTAKQRHGLTRSINLGAWQAGGMGTDANRKVLEETTGMRPMQTAAGIEAFYRSLILPHSQLLVAEGDLSRLRHALTARRTAVPELAKERVEVTESISSEILAEKMQDYLRREFSELLQVPAHKIDSQAPLENYGIDSILAMKLTNKLEQTFGSLSKTLFFEYQTIAGLAGYFLKAHPAIMREHIAVHHGAAASAKDEIPGAKAVAITKERKLSVPARRSNKRFATSRAADDQQEIAIIGMAGRYPQAENLEEFWKNLQNGRDSITEIPLERWDHSLYYDPDPNKLGKSYTKWGGFIDDVDKFDPLFFNIAPREAALIDPQERLFLQTVWETIEDAGYTKAAISANRVGVYVGVMWGQYELFAVDSILRGEPFIPSSSFASIANRVSYFFDFHGPSIALDTMCSSSLTAIHLACGELRRGESDVAIAGGVNVSIHPSKYLGLSQGKFGASDGRCRSFGQGGDGYVPGEGVGAVLLKPLDKAVRDGDQIYAVVKSSALNHGGKTNGYTVPNPNSQGDLVLDALKKANIHPGTLGYLETHGTGTSLGDPIEITGLIKAFEGTVEKQFCPIGSVKSNIGHLESAAGIAAVTKALLQIKHKQLVPSLHAVPPNPNINFQDSPFYVQTELAEWKYSAAHPRRVGVSSFGAGGSNAHLILEEYAKLRESNSAWPGIQREAFILSAKDWNALVRYAEKINRFLSEISGVSLADTAHTLQVGRTPMDTRLVVIASTVEELVKKLGQWVALRKSNNGLHSEVGITELENVFSGNVREVQYNAGDLIEGRAGKIFINDLLTNKELEKLARLWVLGATVDWSLLCRDATPRRISLPTYPFAKERCWIKINQQLSVPGVVQKRTLDSGKAAIRDHREEKQRAYYVGQWILRPITAREERPASGPVLVLDASDELFLRMKEQLENEFSAEAIVLVKPGNSFQEIGPNIYTINVEQEEQFHELMETLKSKALLPRVVVHHCSDVCDFENTGKTGDHLKNGVYELLYLSKALMKGKHRAQLNFLAVFSSGPGVTAPLSAALGGFLKSLVLENPSCTAKVIEIESEPGADGASALLEKAGLIWSELGEKDWMTQEVRYRGQLHGDERKCERYVSELVKHTRLETRSSALPLKENGIYLITGGLGGLGLIFAEYLAKNFKARLVLLGRSAPNERQQEKLEQLRAYGAETLVLQVDVSNLEDVKRAVRESKARFSEINGVIHAAGVNRDSFILNKTREEMESVLAPKVQGTINLDLATSGENLDFFVLFSSIAGVLGNLGQSDYAYANHFLDFFAENRESLRKAHRRCGQTLSVNWPLWEEGGMSVSPEQVAVMERQTGISPLPTEEGIRCWEELLRSEALQGVALYGTPSRMAAFIAQKSVQSCENVTTPSSAVDSAALFTKTEEYLKTLIGEEIKLAPERIGSSDRLESFGIDSVMIHHLNLNLEKQLGPLPKTLLYQHETVQELAQFLMKEARQELVALFGLAGIPSELASAPVATEESTVRDGPPVLHDKEDTELIAVIGMHGYYPHSATLAEYWENLKHAKDLIDLVPPDRWNYEQFYDPDPAAAADGKIYCKWGGFLEDYDKFDAQFFKISAEEARAIDPEARLFLPAGWAAMEDAGYTRESLKRGCPKAKSADVGVFVGVTTNSYHLWGPEERSRGNNIVPASLPWSIANRVSYFFDFSGPSLPVDTACSSSLVAVHLACESLKNRECQIAIAGGVNLYLHPSKYQSLCQRRMLSLNGKCHSYGAGNDGFVPGEGVGTLVLKPLSKAIEHQDHIYAVIPASAFDHSGRSNGYSAPNPNAQANLISRTFQKAHIHPETISYVEGHGTGTQLGDGIEIAALTQAFQTQTTRKQFCPIGSVKGNVGHSESAAGIGSMAKVILQLKHQQLVPSIHSEEANPNMDLEGSPFYLQHGLSDWKSPSAEPRRALVNSFGAGGVNACVLLQEFQENSSADLDRIQGPYLFTLSAKNEERLREYAGRLLTHLRGEQAIDLAGLCYTLQTGREAMEERLAVVITEVDELIIHLDEWSKLGSSPAVYHSHADRNQKRTKMAKTADQGLSEIASHWVAGRDVDWDSLYSAGKPCRISLPTYPFARERYWVSSTQEAGQRATNAQLHPLISYNSSTLKEVSFSSSLSDKAFYAVDHKVNEEGIFPGAGLLELACIAGSIAAERRVRKIKDIVWVHPVRFGKGAQTVRTSLKNVQDIVEYVISSFDDENEAIIHSEGKLIFNSASSAPAGAEDRIAIEELKARCASSEDGTSFYRKFGKHGLNYGSSFQTIQEIYINDSYALAKLKVPDSLKPDFGQFLLHPSIIDGALQTAAGLVRGLESGVAHLPYALDEVDILHPVRQACYAYAQLTNSGEQNHTGVKKFNIRLLNESGDVLIHFRNLFARALPALQVKPRSIQTDPVTGDNEQHQML